MEHTTLNHPSASFVFVYYDFLIVHTPLPITSLTGTQR